MKQSFHHLFIVFTLFLLLFFEFTAPVLAQNNGEGSFFEGFVDPHTNLKALYLSVNSRSGGEDINPELVYVLEGVVSAREVLQSAEIGFVGLLEITVGEWIGLEDVVAYRCYVEIEGERFEGMIPEGRVRTPDPRDIPLNAKVLVFGRYLGYAGGENGSPRYPYLEGEAVRIIW